MPQRTNRIGRHLATSGGLKKTLDTARELGCETAQIFISNPQGFATRGISGLVPTLALTTVK